MTVEERVRAATRAIAGTVHDVRPLYLPSSPPPRTRWWHRWQHRAAPLAAAAAMAAIGIALAIVQNVPNGQGVPLADPAASGGVPAYYVAIDAPAAGNSPDRAVVGDTRTGARLATVSPPAHGTFSGVAGAADDQTFVLGVAPLLAGNPFPAGKEGSRSWYLLRIAPGTDRSTQLTRLPIPMTSAEAVVYGMALSPNGGKLAVASRQIAPRRGPDLLRIYSVATGALLRTWSGPPPNRSQATGRGLAADANAALSWTADGRTLAFGYDEEVRMLEVTRPGQDLIADSRLVFAMTQFGFPTLPQPQPLCAALAVTSDGKTVVCVVTPTKPGPGGATAVWTGLVFQEYSTATGKLTRVLYRYHEGYSEDPKEL